MSQVLTHRYSFTGAAGSPTITDSVGSQNGSFSGSSGGQDGSGNLVLNGIDGYVDLGANLISSYTNITVEAWVNVSTNDVGNARLFDFGDTDPDTGLGAYGMDCSPSGGGHSTFEVFNTDPGFNSAQNITASSVLGIGRVQLVVVYNPPFAAMYTNGVLAASGSINIPFSQLVDSHDYIGRSGYTTDPYLAAALNEFRVYTGDLSPQQIAIDAASGPASILGSPGSLTNISLSLSNTNYASARFVATVSGNYQNVQGVNLSFASPTLTSGNTNIVQIGTNLALTALSPGTTTVTASYGGYSATQTVTVLALPAVLTHRYEFNEPAGSTTFADSVGSANGTLVGSASLDGNGNLVLPGGTSPNNNNYAALPANLITGYNALTFECWVNFGSNPVWGRLVDFGDTDTNGLGAYVIDFTPHSGNLPNGVNFEVSDSDPGFNDAPAAAAPPVLDNSGPIQVAMVFNPIAQSLTVYTNGVVMAQNNNVTIPLSAIQDVHSYLGKSSYAGDPNGVATVDEFRIYNGALSGQQIAFDAASGSGTIITNSGSLTNINLIVATSLDAGVPVSAAVTADYTGLQGVNLSFAGSAVVLTSGNTAILTVGSGGIITPVSPGTTTLTATYQGYQSVLTITVTSSSVAVIAHRYSFGGTAGSSTIADSVGGQDGTFSGSSGGLDGNSNLVLNGIDGYVDLGPELLSGYTNISVEAWVEVDTNDAQNARLFDFGDTDEITGLGAYGMDLSPHGNANGNNVTWFEVFNGDPGFNSVQQIQSAPLNGAGLTMVVAVYDPQLSYAVIFTNGVQAARGSINIPFSQLVDSHDYIGRSGYSGDSYLTATLKEFRVYTGDLTAAQVAAHYAAGPGTLPENEPVLSITRSGSNITLSWPGSFTGFSVQTTQKLGTGVSWGPLSGNPTPVLNNGVYQVTVPVTTQTAFYSLTK